MLTKPPQKMRIFLEIFVVLVEIWLLIVMDVEYPDTVGLKALAYAMHTVEDESLRKISLSRVMIQADSAQYRLKMGKM